MAGPLRVERKQQGLGGVPRRMRSASPARRRAKDNTTVHHGEIDLHGERLPFCLRQGPRRKYARLVVTAEGAIEVRAPARFSAQRATAFIRANAAWVLETLGRVRELERRRPTLETGTALPRLGETLRLVVHRAPRQLVRREGQELRIQGPSLDAPRLRMLFERWYRLDAQQYLPERLRHWGGSLGVEPRKVTVRGQKTLWGSCSARGDISLNWRLMLLSSDLVDYVLVHELCHLRHMNHSAGFWAMVESTFPDYRERRTRLRATPPAPWP